MPWAKANFADAAEGGSDRYNRQSFIADSTGSKATDYWIKVTSHKLDTLV
jgi:hypothetical protein